jgi:hypothetical protein
MLNWRRSLTISAVSGAVVMSVIASAQTADPPLFSFFKTFCADTRGDEGAIKKAVEAVGGQVTMLPDTDTSPLKMRWEKGTDEQKIRLAAGGWYRSANRENPNERYLTDCYVWDSSHDVAGAEAIRNWVGIPPSDTRPFAGTQKTTYTYKDVAGVRSAIPNDRFNDTDDVWRLDVMDLVEASGGAIYVHLYHSTLAGRRLQIR